MNNKVRELMDRLARRMALYKYGGKPEELYPHWVRDATFEVEDILSQEPGLYYRNYNIEVRGLEDLHNAFIPLAEELSNKESVLDNPENDGTEWEGPGVPYSPGDE